MSRQYITTAIDYPNSAPHMGHVLEKVLADVIVRWMRLRRDAAAFPRGEDAVRFQIGTDEHGSKIQQKAESEGLTTQVFVDRNSRLFVDLYDQLGISYDDFFRTTDRKRHWPTVIALWKILREAGMLEKRTYIGLYCSGCERFLTRKELLDGKCPDHLVEPEEVREENWFYRLSDDQALLKRILAEPGGLQIVPGHRSHEVLSLLKRGLEDTSFSRPRSKVYWGVPVPDDEDQIMYVWCDALTNYISSLGFFTEHEHKEWWDDAEVTHVIGKDIARFHALLWPSMLHHADVQIPTRLLIHGFLTSEGQKMSKSIGNVVVPQDVIGRYGVDALRFFLSHQIPVGNDGDFSWVRFGEWYDAVMRNQLGNLLNRVLVLLNREGGKLDATYPSPAGLQSRCMGIWKEYPAFFGEYQVHLAAMCIVGALYDCNQHMGNQAPWAKESAQKVALLTEFAEALRHITLMLLPFVPETARKMAKQLNLPNADRILRKDFVITDQMKEWGGERGWTVIGGPEILFPPVE